MKIKHWMGYGKLDATKIKKTENRGCTTLVVKVKGNHEYGIHRDDVYDVMTWLVKKFDKETNEKTQIISLKLTDGTENDIETCEYEIVYRKR